MEKSGQFYIFNFTNNTNLTFVSVDIDFKSSYIATFVFNIFFMLFGTFINIWLLVAILKSPDLRTRMRNKLICSMCVLHLVDSLIIIPLSLGLAVAPPMNYKTSCILKAAQINIELIPEAITNWLLVILIAIFIAQIVNFNVNDYFSPKARSILEKAMLVVPWVLSLLLVPLIIYDFHRRLFQDRLPTWAECPVPIHAAFLQFKMMDTFVPLALAVVLLVVAAGLKYRCFSVSHYSSTSRAELMSPGPEVDSVFVYTTAVFISFACDVLLSVVISDYFAFLHYGIQTWLDMIAVVHILSDSRVLVMIIPWLLLPDIRERIKTWRPWYRPAPGIDLTVAFNKSPP